MNWTHASQRNHERVVRLHLQGFEAASEKRWFDTIWQEAITFSPADAPPPQAALTQPAVETADSDDPDLFGAVGGGSDDQGQTASPKGKAGLRCIERAKAARLPRFSSLTLNTLNYLDDFAVAPGKKFHTTMDATKGFNALPSHSERRWNSDARSSAE